MSSISRNTESQKQVSGWWMVWMTKWKHSNCPSHLYSTRYFVTLKLKVLKQKESDILRLDSAALSFQLALCTSALKIRVIKYTIHTIQNS